MRILAIESTSMLGSVALLHDGQPAPTVHWLSGPRRHTSELLPVIETVLDEAGLELRQLDRLGWSSGPGSFTGLRVGATVVRTLGMTLGIPVVSVPTLDVIAANAVQNGVPAGPLGVLQDALQGEAYAARYTLADGEIRREQAPERVDPQTWLAAQPEGIRLLGSGCRHLAEGTPHVLTEALWEPSAGSVGALAAAGQGEPASEVRPNYMRRPSCEEVYEQRRAEAIARRADKA